MGLFDKLKGELIDIIEWLDDSNDTLLYRFERYGNEIKNGAKLTVRENQVAVFMNEGKTADIFQPGMYTLETKNLPLLSTLQGWKYGFNSPFKAEVYFINTRAYQMKWGTMGGGGAEGDGGFPYYDPTMGLNVNVKAFGGYTIKVVDPKKLMSRSGTDGHFTVEELEKFIKDAAIEVVMSVVGAAGVPLPQLPSKIPQLSATIKQELSNKIEIKNAGLECESFQIASFKFPADVEKMMKDLMGDMMRNQKMGDPNAIYKKGMVDAMNKAADNDGGAMNGFMGVGMMNNVGGGMMNNMFQNNNQQPNNQQMPPPITPPTLTQYFVAVNGAQAGPFDMNMLSQMVKQGGLTKESQVWKQGMAAWTPAGQVAELASIFNSVPPPIPQ